MTFALVSAEEAVYPKALMGRALGLSRSGHHAFRTRKASPRALARQRLDVQVAAIFKERKGRYGAPRSICRSSEAFCFSWPSSISSPGR